MGSFSSMNRCDRFIHQFNDWAKQAFPLPEKLKGVIKHYGLGFCERDESVQMFWIYADEDGGYTELMVYDTPMFYDPQEDDKGAVERLADAFRDIGVSRVQIIQKLKEAELLSTDFQ